MANSPVVRPRARRRFLQATAAGLATTQLPLLAQPARAGLALLVGNTAYKPSDENLPPAQKSVSDLELRLQRLGFEVLALNDPPIGQVEAELERLQRAVDENPALAAVFYFCGHGFQSNAENYLVPAGGDLQSAPAHLSKTCMSLERDVFSRLTRRAGPAATVIMVDACRTPDRPRTPGEGYNQTMPPDGCHVVFATGPGKRAFAPNDPQRLTLFTDVLVSELDLTDPARSILLTLETVRVKVAKRVNSIPTIVRVFGPNAQEPEVASNVRGDPKWVPSGAARPSTAAPLPGTPATELEAARQAASPQDAAARLKALLPTLPEGDEADIAQLRLKDLETVLRAARSARLPLDAMAQFAAAQPPRIAEDVQRALRGDKYAALRVAETLPLPAAGELIERSDHGRWMIFAANLGNGIAAYRLSLHFRNVDRRDAEASRYLNLARANNYTPPRQLDSKR